MVWGGYICVVLSILGIDGYIQEFIPTYYLIGEWFLGAIIILYLLYPLHLFCYKKSPLVTTLVIMGLFIMNEFCNIFPMSETRTVPYCLFYFNLGFLFEDNKEKLERIKILVLITSFVVAFIWLFVKLPFLSSLQAISYTPFIIALFILIFSLRKVSLPDFCNKFIALICKLSYLFFLVHHVIISFFTKFMLRYTNNSVLGLMFIFFLVLFASWSIYICYNFIVMRLRRNKSDVKTSLVRR